jgi:AraC-like DNA-binding protein
MLSFHVPIVYLISVGLASSLLVYCGGGCDHFALNSYRRCEHPKLPSFFTTTERNLAWIMKPEDIQRLRAGLQSLSSVVGVPILWRPAYIPHNIPGIPPEQIMHYNPFCMAVKADQTRHPHCNHTESTGLNRDFGSSQGMQTKTCFAGVEELVLPIRIGGCLFAFLMAGPFRRPNHPCPYPSLQAEYLKLPVLEPTLRAHIESLLQVFAHQISTSNYDTLTSMSVIGKEPRISLVMAHINSHFGEDLTLTDLAAVAGLSPSHLSRSFKSAVGCSLNQYLTRVRLNQAQRLLSETDRSVVDIALTCGFSQQSWFGAVFRKHYQQTPQAFRRALRDA